MLPPGNIQVVSEQKVILYKPRWRAFYKTCLESHLRRLGTTTIIFTGCNFPNCPRASIMEKSERDFRIIQVRDAVSGLYPQGETEMAKIGVAVLSTEELLAQISRGSEASV